MSTIPTCRLQPTMLEDQVFRSATGEALSKWLSDNWVTFTSKLIDWEVMKAVLRFHCIRSIIGVKADLQNNGSRIETSIGVLEAKPQTDLTKKGALPDALVRHAQLIEQLRRLNFIMYQAKMHADGDMSGCLLAWLLRSTNPPTPVAMTRVSTTFVATN
ncbi:hypothetical protein NDU88_004549 [Pleurodeles waltl]|uniref:Uncharacterized protein n=1 Tax=Pleurodeles waltl TaxID=8319 RepID=A0AAV7LRA4_PLEWA|nr:hypothetical protein NDU88_004549 [Pleurodeles waltl]